MGDGASQRGGEAEEEGSREENRHAATIQAGIDAVGEEKQVG